MNARGRRARLLLLVVVLAVVAFVVWGLGVIGIAQFGEDICITDSPFEATGYQTDASVFPPRVTCVYDTVDGGSVAVDHPLYAYASTVWLVGFPVTAIAGSGAIVVVMLRRPRPRAPASSA